MEPHVNFAFRVASGVAAFLASMSMAQEASVRFHLRKVDGALWLTVALSLLLLGAAFSLSWNALYYFSVISDKNATWMLNSNFVAFYTLIVIGSALWLVHNLTLSWSRAGACLGISIGFGIMAYYWITHYAG